MSRLAGWKIAGSRVMQHPYIHFWYSAIPSPTHCYSPHRGGSRMQSIRVCGRRVSVNTSVRTAIRHRLAERSPRTEIHRVAADKRSEVARCARIPYVRLPLNCGVRQHHGDLDDEGSARRNRALVRFPSDSGGMRREPNRVGGRRAGRRLCRRCGSQYFPRVWR